MRNTWCLLLTLVAAFSVNLLAGSAYCATVPLRGDLPSGTTGDEPVPFCGGIPFASGQLKSADNVRLMGAGGKEIPSQVTATAWWSDGSIKWVMVDAVLSPSATAALSLEYGPDIKRAVVADGLKADIQGALAKVSGPNLSATVSRKGNGILEECTVGGKTVVAAGKPARLVLNTVRVPQGVGEKGFDVNSYLCRDTQALLDEGKLQIDEMAVESPGPIRVTIRLRGHIMLEHFGQTLPKVVLDKEPAGRMPFSMRLSFYRDCPVIFGQHQIIFSGEPDCDFISRWGFELPGQAGKNGMLILEPGVELITTGDKQSVSPAASRLCWAPTATGMAMIRAGWENRPCAITQENGSAWIDFWPQAAGVWDLRRFAREWSVGENGDTRKTELMLNYAKFAARGMAKGLDFVIYAGKQDMAGPTPAVVRSLSGRALLVAKPQWYADTEALGPYAVEQTSGEFAPIDSTFRRQLDYYLYNQDLFQWYGKITYGFWQTRFGEVHRTDRWENDYGRWSWSLNDGNGRIGHTLMLEYLRTLDRRYFDAGMAFDRIGYDTNMIHTKMHLDSCTHWVIAQGCTHRHDVQPFGDPYVGMRGAYPVGQRIAWLLTGDGVLADGLDMVADACYHAATDQPDRLHNSGGSDGEGSAANAMLWKYEVSGDKKYLTACRTLLDKSAEIPPTKAGYAGFGYGPSFGLFFAAGEYAALSGDKEFQDRVVQVGKLGAQQKNPDEFIHSIAMAYRFSKDESLRTFLADTLKKTAQGKGNSLADLPPALWPGHAGYRDARFDFNVSREMTYAIAAVTKAPGAGDWPKVVPPVKAVPAELPKGWYKPGGVQSASETVPAAQALLAMKAGTGGGEIKTGNVVLKAKDSLGDVADVGGASPLAGAIVPYVELATLKSTNGVLATKVELYHGKVEKIGPVAGGAIVAEGKAGPAKFVARLSPAVVDGAPSFRVELAVQVPPGSGQVVSWGLMVPLKLGSDAHALMTTTPGAFRLERCRLDQTDEKVPNWLTSETHWGEGKSLWPKWRLSGIDIGPGRYYRLWRANREDVSPLFCDQGEGDGNWLDITDRGASPRWGLTARVLRPQAAAGDLSRQAIRVNMETGMMQVQFRNAAAEPLPESAGSAGIVGAADLIFHDGWRPPLSLPELTADQYAKFMADLNHDGNYGLCALRFLLSLTHTDNSNQWVPKLSDLGLEPREILYGMMFKDGLAQHCKKIGVQWDPADIEGSVQRVVEHYRK